MKRILAGTLVVAAVATAADWIWYTFGVEHTLTAGIVHGAVLLSVVGGVLGAAAGRPLRGLPIGTIAGVGGAVAYYLFAAGIDHPHSDPAIAGAWIVTWLLLAALEGRWLHAPHVRSWREVAMRGLVAALVAGVAFFLVMNTLWGPPPLGGRNYAVQFVAWAFAWAPGLLALGAGKPPGRPA